MILYEPAHRLLERTDATDDQDDLPFINYTGVGPWMAKGRPTRGLMWKANIVVADFLAGTQM